MSQHFQTAQPAAKPRCRTALTGDLIGPLVLTIHAIALLVVRKLFYNINAHINTAIFIIIASSVPIEVFAKDNPTRVCVRRIEAVKYGEGIDAYELVMVQSSGDQYKDVTRIRIFYTEKSILRGSHMKSFQWIGAELYEHRMIAGGLGRVDKRDSQPP